MLYAFKACWHEDSRAAARCNSFTLARALAAAIEAKVQQINMSLAGPHDPLLARLVEQALKRKIVIVAAAPPEGVRGGFPAELSSVLAAAPLEDGPHDARIVVAPGQDIPTLVPNGGYDFAFGSSIAAAEVSGVVALLLARNPQLDAAAIREILQTSRPRPLNAASSIDACRALAAVDPRDPCGPDQTALGAELH
jgi:subtilisin family serine protease